MSHNGTALVTQSVGASLRITTMTQSQILVLLNQAKQSLAQVHSIEEIKEARDRYKALLAYLKQKNASMEALRMAEEIVTRHELEIGKVLLEIAKTDGKKAALDFAISNGIKETNARQWLSGAEVVGKDAEGAIKTAKVTGKPTFSKTVEAASANADDSLPGIILPTLGRHQSARSDELSKLDRTSFNDIRVSEYKGDEWYTPKTIIDLARKVMGTISLDPASADAAQETVKAERYFTKEKDGLVHPWSGKVWLAPPYSHKLIVRFVSRLCLNFNGGNVTEALVLVHAYTTSQWYQQLVHNCNAVCFLNRRVAFSKGDEFAMPPMGQNIFYFGENQKRFVTIFGGEGVILRPLKT